MISNLEKFKADLERLLAHGKKLEFALQHHWQGKAFETAVAEKLGEKAADFLEKLPKFTKEYQSWYSEAVALIKQLLPDRLADFKRHYEKPQPRLKLTFESYRIIDSLQGTRVTLGHDTIVDIGAAVPHFEQQMAILNSVKARFESSLFEIRQLVQADLFDSELQAAKELLKHKFSRAAGALAGVVLEKHLAQVCGDHAVKITKKNPGISDLNELLKNSGVIDVPQWRFIQHLADIRNLCDHNKKIEPTQENVSDLLDGVAKITKTVF